MHDVKQFEDLFRSIGVKIGHALAARLVEAQDAQPIATPASERTPAPPSTARILPGLPGRRRRAGEAAPRCGRADCDRPARTRGYCQTHYVQWLKAGEQRRAG